MLRTGENTSFGSLRVFTTQLSENPIFVGTRQLQAKDKYIKKTGQENVCYKIELLFPLSSSSCFFCARVSIPQNQRGCKLYLSSTSATSTRFTFVFKEDSRWHLTFANDDRRGARQC